MDRAEQLRGMSPQLVLDVTLYPTKMKGRKSAALPGWGCPCCVSRQEPIVGYDGWLLLGDTPIEPGERRRLGFVFLSGEEAASIMRQARPVRAAQRLETAKGMTFQECAVAYIDAHQAGWRNAKHRQQWPNTLKTYAYPLFGSLPVQAVDLPLVLKAIEPIWKEKPETASRLRGRIEAVLDWASVRGYRRGDNPARWRGHLDSLLPSKSKVRAVEHHSALPYDKMGAFMETLRAQEGISARALEFTILTAARTSEAIGATWDEIDLQAKLWTIPANRIKAGREHRVPLSVPALAILEAMQAVKTNDFVFPGN